MAIDLILTEPQERFIFSTALHPAMCAGYGAGKSQAGVIRILLRAMQYPGMNFAFVEPTFDLVRLIAWPRFEEVLDAWGIGYQLNKSESVMTLANGSRIIFRSADNPARLVGFEVADAVIDEADVLSQKDAQEVWVKMIGRARQKKHDGAANTVACVSTPEGHKWMYHTFERAKKPGYELIRAPTSSNPYLPSGYLDALKATYPANLLMAYCEGYFTNLTSGAVYAEFDRTLNASTETVQPGEALHVGQDFNVAHGAAVIHVLRGDDPHAVAELTGVFDTPAMIALLKRDYAGHPIMIYPDASGNNRKSNNASESDIALLRAAGFRICVNAANPRVKDRVLAANAMIHKEGARRYRVNPERCPQLVESLEKQAYTANGEPDKSGGLDHCFTADTLVNTPDGIKRLDELPAKGLVMGPFGQFVRYENAGKKIDSAETIRVVLSSGHEIKCTPEHQVLTEDGQWTQAKDLIAGQALFLSYQTQSRNTLASSITAAVSIFRIAASACIGGFGRMLMERSRPASMFTTKMATEQTTNSSTLTYFPRQSITKSMLKTGLPLEKEHGIPVTGRKFLSWLLNGTGQMRGGTGTESTTRSTELHCTKNVTSGHAKSAVQNSPQPTLRESSAPVTVEPSTGESPALTTKAGRAPFAGMLLKLISIRGLPVAVKRVLLRLAVTEYHLRKFFTACRAARIKTGRSAFLGQSIAPINAEQVTVRAILPSESAPVYCLTAPIHGAFALANGVVVANCIDAATYFVVYRYPLTPRPAMSISLRSATN